MGIDDLSIDELMQQKDVPGLIEALKNPEGRIRERVAFVLGRVGDKRAIPALIAALKDPAYIDPSEEFRGNPAFEEMGRTDLIYYVRKEAWRALTMIWAKTATDYVEPLPGINPFKVGDIVAQYRVYCEGSSRFSCWRNPDPSMQAARWKVLSITRNEVMLELVEGIHEEEVYNHDSIFHYPGYVARVSSSENFRNMFRGAKGKQLAFDTFKKVKLP